MREDARVQLAGSMGSFFKIDPLVILKASYFDWSLRLAAFQHAVDEKNKAIEEARARRT